MRDYLLLQRIIPEPMDRVAHYCVQTEEYARRFRSVGVAPQRLTITGSMKFDNVADDVPPGARAACASRLGLEPGVFVLVAGSTHSGEEEVVLDAFDEILRRDPRARLVLVPRFPERVGEVESLVRAGGHTSVRLSALPVAGPAPAEARDAVVIVDTVGELARLYVVADLVFVGGSLTKRGGQSMIEPAGFGKAVVVGPATWNFRDPVELLRSRGGLVQAPDAQGVREQVLALHADPERRSVVGERARDVCRESKGATRRIFDILVQYLTQVPMENSA